MHFGTCDNCMNNNAIGFGDSMTETMCIDCAIENGACPTCAAQYVSPSPSQRHWDYVRNGGKIDFHPHCDCKCNHLYAVTDPAEMTAENADECMGNDCETWRSWPMAPVDEIEFDVFDRTLVPSLAVAITPPTRPVTVDTRHLRRFVADGDDPVQVWDAKNERLVLMEDVIAEACQR